MGTNRNKPSRRNALGGYLALGGCLNTLFLLGVFGIVPLILLYVFGFSIKTTPEYDCVIRRARSSAQVIAITGEPLTPGLFAWTSYFESGGGLRQGRFSTTLSGPQGRAKIVAEFYRTPIGATLGIWLKTNEGEIEIYNGAYPCE